MAEPTVVEHRDTEARLGEIVATNTAADGTVNYVAVLDTLNGIEADTAAPERSFVVERPQQPALAPQRSRRPDQPGGRQ